MPGLLSCCWSRFRQLTPCIAATIIAPPDLIGTTNGQGHGSPPDSATGSCEAGVSLVKRPYKKGQSLPGGLERNGAKTPEIGTSRRSAQGFSASRQESSFPAPVSPPLAHRKPEMKSLAGPFFFLFHRGLARPSDFRRLAFGSELVSESPASLSTRPSHKSRRIQKVTPFQHVVENELRRS
jgi:hypothetical protein